MNQPAASPLTRDEWRLVLLLSAINFVHILDFVIVMPLGNLLRMLRDVASQANHLWSFAFMLAMVFGTFMIVPYIAFTGKLTVV